MKILLIHGIGGAEQGTDHGSNYYTPWKESINRSLTESGDSKIPTYVDFFYDDLFTKYPASGAVYAEAIAGLLASAAYHSVTDPISDLTHPASRGFDDFQQTIRWHAGMVAQFVVQDDLRKELRNRLRQKLIDVKPDLVISHSLGSLLAYDLLRNDPRPPVARQVDLITIGSQIGNVFVRSKLWPGRLMMPKVKYWHHLFNPQDPVLTARITIPDTKNYYTFETPSRSGHSPVRTPAGPGYLDHPNTKDYIWKLLARPAAAARAFTHRVTAVERVLEKPKRRALLVGINNYPNSADRLEGCVNDVYLMSSILQERGFDAEDIRVVLNERATAEAIRERLAWLLQGAGDGMERVFYYSGHGAKLPGYNAAEIVDHQDECLVPHDFNWTKESAITDDDFYHLYSDLPLSAKFIGIIDCCQASGMTRDGGQKARGLTPPDDIRHRMLRWNSAQQMWEERDWKKEFMLNPDYGSTKADRALMMGSNGITYRIGRGMKLRRTLSKAAAKKLVKQNKALYLPALLQACGENELSYEYRHGTVSYGAFTYAMAKHLRKNPGISLELLISEIAATLVDIGYQQTPELVAPSVVKNRPMAGVVPKSPIISKVP